MRVRYRKIVGERQRQRDKDTERQGHRKQRERERCRERQRETERQRDRQKDRDIRFDIEQSLILQGLMRIDIEQGFMIRLNIKAESSMFDIARYRV